MVYYGQSEQRIPDFHQSNDWNLHCEDEASGHLQITFNVPDKICAGNRLKYIQLFFLF